MDLVSIFILVIVYQATPFYGKSLPKSLEASETITNNKNRDITDLLHKIEEQNVHFELYSELKGFEDANLMQIKSMLQKKGDDIPFAIIIARNDLVNENFGTDKEENLKQITEKKLPIGDKTAVALKKDEKKVQVYEDQVYKKLEKNNAVKNNDSYIHDDDSFTKEMYKGIINEVKPNLPVIEEDIRDKQAAKAVSFTFSDKNDENKNDIDNFNFSTEERAFKDIESTRIGSNSSLNPFRNQLAKVPNTLAKEDTASLYENKSADYLKRDQMFLKVKTEDEERANDSNENKRYSEGRKPSMGSTDFDQVHIEPLKNNTDTLNQTEYINSDEKNLVKELLNEKNSNKKFTKSKETADTEPNNMTFEDNISNKTVLQSESMMGNSYEDPSDDNLLIEQTIEDGNEKHEENKIIKNYINIACKTDIHSGRVRDNNSRTPTCYISFDLKM